MIGVSDILQHIDTTSHSSSINKTSLSDSANDIKDKTYCIKETETFDQASYKAMGNDLWQTDYQYFLSKYDDFNNDSDDEIVGKLNSELLWGHHLERAKKITQADNNFYTTFKQHA